MSNTELLERPQQALHKELYRQMSICATRRNVQVNPGRVQQATAESYYTGWHQSLPRLTARASVDSYSTSATSEFWATVAEQSASILDKMFVIIGRTISATVPPPGTSAIFISIADLMDKRGKSDAALDVIYSNINYYLTQGRIEMVDSLLRILDPATLSVDLLLGLLTATLPARYVLPSRAQFFSAVQNELKKRGEWEEGLLTGLES